MKRKIWQPVVRALSVFLTVVIVFGAVINSKLEAEAADTFLGIQNLISEVSNGYQESQDKYTILEIVPDRSASEIGYLFDGYEPALSVWDETNMRWKGWKEQLGECADEAARRLLIEGDGTEGSGLKAKLKAYYAAQGITNGPVAYSSDDYQESATAQEGYELIEFAENKKTGWFEPLGTEGPGFDVTFGVKVYDSTKTNTAYYNIMDRTPIADADKNGIADDDIVYIENTDAEGNVAYYPFYWAEVSDQINNDNPPECYLMKYERINDYSTLRDGQFVYTADRITRSDNGEYGFIEGTLDAGGQSYVLGKDGIYVKNTFTNNNWFHKYVLGMTAEEYGSFPVEVISYTPTELETARSNNTFSEFDFLYINSGKSTDNKNTDVYDGWHYSSSYNATNKQGGDISSEVGAKLFSIVQTNSIPCIVDGNIIFKQNESGGSVLKNEDMDSTEIFKLCTALCQDSLGEVNYNSYTLGDEEDMNVLWSGLAVGYENGHFATDHVYCHTGENSFINDDFSNEWIYSGEGEVPSGFGKVLDEIELENLYRQSDTSGEYDVLPTKISPAVVVRHIMNHKNRRNEEPKKIISVLEIQPAKTENGESELTLEQIKKWSPTVEDAHFTVMTTAEFIGKIETLNDKYDLIYIGTCKDHMNTVKGTDGAMAVGSTIFNDHAMDGLIYYHTGDKRYVGMQLSGQLDTEYLGNNRNNNVFFYVPTRYSGNDITKEKMNALLSYLNGSYPVVVSDEFFESPVTLFQHENFVGYSVNLGEGSYTLADLEAYGLRNDDITSMKISEGYQAYLYEDDGFNINNDDKLKIFIDYDNTKNGEISNVQNEDVGFINDALSSLIVERKEGVIPDKKINTDHIDNSSYMYEFVDKALKNNYGNFYKFSDIADDSELFQYYLNRPKVNLINTSANGSKSKDNDKVYLLDAVNGVYTLEYHFTIVNEGAASADTKYQCKLYIDVNSDGKFSSQEVMDDIEVTCSSQRVDSNQLYGGNEYILRRVVPDGYKGVLPWKVEISQVNNSNIYCSMEGYTKLTGLEKETINIIQISRDHILEPDWWDYDTERFFSLAEQINGKKTIDARDEETGVKIGAYSSDTLKVDGYENNLYYKLVQGISNEFDIDVDFYTIYAFEEEFKAGNIDMDEYNMLILGFADAYGEFSGDKDDPTTPLGSIVKFINSGKSVLMSHDNMSFFNYEYGKRGIVNRQNPNETVKDTQYHHAYSLNQNIRGLVGMDRYGIMLHKANKEGEPLISSILKTGASLKNGSPNWSMVEASGKDMAYAPKSARQETVPEVQGYTYTVINARDKDSIEEVISKEYSEEETGVTDGWPNTYLNIKYDTVYYNDGISGKGQYDNGEIPSYYDAEVTNLYVTQVNQGQITEYPYKLKDTFQVATTHGQYYQLDFNADDDNDGQSDMVVWYCLGPRKIDSEQTHENDSEQTQETIYSMSPNDVSNNYYIYTKGNITYTGMGHAGIESANMEEEAKLFINTMIAAYKAGTKPPTITIQEGANYAASELKVLYRYFDDDFALDTANDSGEHEKIYFTVRDNNFVKGTRNLTLRAFYEAEDGDKSILVKNENITVKELERNGNVFNADTGEAVDPDKLQSGGIYYIKIPKSVLGECDDSGMQIYLETQSIINTTYKEVKTDKIYAKLDVMKVYLFDLN